ncbi:MAG TPA: hypothetical protein PLH57_09035, partial [Oligoflexia bacterium]|nr:hypothetical protein [Oligoflexia bacterium]
LIEPILSANIAKNLIDDSPDEYLVQMAQGAVCVSGLFRRLQKLDVILGGPRFKTKNYSTGTALLAEPVPESDFADVAFEATAQVATSLAGLGVLGMLGDQGMMGSSQTFPDGETLYDVCSPSSKFWSTYNTGTASITIDGTNYSYFYSKKDTPKRGTYSVGEFCKQIGAEYKAIADEINEIVGSYSVLSTPIGKNRAYFELTQKLVDANLEIPKNIKNFEHGNDWNDPAKWVCGVSFNHPETGEKVSTPVYSRSGDFIYEKSTCAQSVPQDILDEIRALNLPNLKYHALGIDYNSRKYRDNPENKSPSCMTRAKNSFNTKSEQLALAKAASEIVTVNKTKVLSGIEDEILRVACGKEKVVASRNLSGPNDPLRPNEKLVAVDAVTTNTRNYKRNKSYRADLIARTIDDSEKTGIRDEVLLRPELMSAFLNCKRRPFERLYTLSGLDVESAKNLSQKMSCDGRDKYRDYACVLKSNIVDPAIADKDIRKAARAKLLADLGQALSFVEAVTAPVLVPMG